jgi:hypothetical protein
MKLHRLMALSLSIIGLVWCVGVGIYIWATPLTYTRHSSGSPSFKIQVPFSEASLLGPVPLLIPVVLAMTAVWAVAAERLGVLVGTTLIFVALSFLGGFSVGGAYLPAAGLVGLAAVVAAYEDVRRLGQQ